MKRGKIILLMAIVLIPFISASDVLVWQGQYYTGTTFNTGTYEFNFSVYDALTEGDICYSNTTHLTTGEFGEWKTEQSGVSSACSNVSKDYYLNINIDGTDQTPRRRLTIFNYLRKDVNEVTAGDLVLHGVLQGLSPLKLQDEINFIKSDGTVTSALYNAPRETSSTLPSVFADSLIHDIIQETNDYGMQECFWDENTETMQMCISGAYLSGRATTISRSLQIVGNTTSKSVDEDFTLCEGNNYVDCETDLTGADLLVEDDIEAIGSIFSQENITADDTGFFTWLGSLTSRITKLFVQDIDVSGNLTGITKEVFYLAETSSNEGSFRVRSVGTNGDRNFNLVIPDDFVSLVSIEAVGIISGAGAEGTGKDIDLTSNCVGAAELYTSNSVSDTTSTYTIPAVNTIWEVDVSSVFSGISAGDYCGINIDHKGIGGGIDYLGIKLKYEN